MPFFFPAPLSLFLFLGCASGFVARGWAGDNRERLVNGYWRLEKVGRVYASTIDHALHASRMNQGPGQMPMPNDPITLCPPNFISWIVPVDIRSAYNCSSSRSRVNDFGGLGVRLEVRILIIDSNQVRKTVEMQRMW
ncbi:hypothetical protein F4805DRAFT_200451 [Annulohypoxylon moriforme]|nr:hypothetical protein F4805DRAFT_200451 [Annulohypoxylon moriforme]